VDEDCTLIPPPTVLRFGMDRILKAPDMSMFPEMYSSDGKLIDKSPRLSLMIKLPVKLVNCGVEKFVSAEQLEIIIEDVDINPRASNVIVFVFPLMDRFPLMY
jgi:hypothetical protein